MDYGFSRFFSASYKFVVEKIKTIIAQQTRVIVPKLKTKRRLIYLQVKRYDSMSLTLPIHNPLYEPLLKYYIVFVLINVQKPKI